MARITPKKIKGFTTIEEYNTVFNGIEGTFESNKGVDAATYERYSKAVARRIDSALGWVISWFGVDPNNQLDHPDLENGFARLPAVIQRHLMEAEFLQVQYMAQNNITIEIANSETISLSSSSLSLEPQRWQTEQEWFCFEARREIIATGLSYFVEGGGCQYRGYEAPVQGYKHHIDTRFKDGVYVSEVEWKPVATQLEANKVLAQATANKMAAIEHLFTNQWKTLVDTHITHSVEQLRLLNEAQAKIILDNKNINSTLTTNHDNIRKNKLLVDALEVDNKRNTIEHQTLTSNMVQINQLMSNVHSEERYSARFVFPANVGGYPMAVELGHNHVLLELPTTPLGTDIKVDGSSRFFLENDAEHFTFEYEGEYFYSSGQVDEVVIICNIEIPFANTVVGRETVELGRAKVDNTPDKVGVLKFIKSFNKEHFKKLAKNQNPPTTLLNDSIEGLTVEFKGYLTGGANPRVGIKGQDINTGYMQISKEVGEALVAKLGRVVHTKFTDHDDTPSTYAGNANAFMMVSKNEDRVVLKKPTLNDLAKSNVDQSKDGLVANENGVLKIISKSTGAIPQDISDLKNVNPIDASNKDQVLTVNVASDGTVTIVPRDPQGATQFIELTDTPALTIPGKRLVTKMAGGKPVIEYADDTFATLLDTPVLAPDNSVLTVDSTGKITWMENYDGATLLKNKALTLDMNGNLKWSDINPGVSMFTHLTDTPNVVLANSVLQTDKDANLFWGPLPVQSIWGRDYFEVGFSGAITRPVFALKKSFVSSSVQASATMQLLDDTRSGTASGKPRQVLKLGTQQAYGVTPTSQVVDIVLRGIKDPIDHSDAVNKQTLDAVKTELENKIVTQAGGLPTIATADHGKFLRSSFVDGSPEWDNMTFGELKDTPSGRQANKYFGTDAQGAMLWKDAPAGGGGSSTFIGLSDTTNMLTPETNMVVTEHMGKPIVRGINPVTELVIDFQGMDGQEIRTSNPGEKAGTFNLSLVDQSGKTLTVVYKYRRARFMSVYSLDEYSGTDRQMASSSVTNTYGQTIKSDITYNRLSHEITFDLEIAQPNGSRDHLADNDKCYIQKIYVSYDQRMLKNPWGAPGPAFPAPEGSIYPVTEN